MTISVIYLVTFHPNILFLETKSLFLENKSSLLDNLFLELKKKLLWTEKCIWMILFVKIITIIVTSKVTSVTLCTM
jgi:hypothetical protein